MKTADLQLEHWYRYTPPPTPEEPVPVRKLLQYLGASGDMMFVFAVYRSGTEHDPQERERDLTLDGASVSLLTPV